MMKKSKKKKAFCGDGILRYCLGKIFMESSLEYTSKLDSNKILTKIVKKNPHIFGNYKTNEHTTGTVFESYLFDFHERYGMEKCVEFIKKVYDIGERDSYTVYWKLL